MCWYRSCWRRLRWRCSPTAPACIMRSKSLAASPAKREARADDEAFDDEDDDGGVLALGAIVHWWLSLKSSCAARSPTTATAGRHVWIRRRVRTGCGRRRADRRVRLQDGRPATRLSAASPVLPPNWNRLSRTIATTSTSPPRCSARAGASAGARRRIPARRPAPVSPVPRRARPPARARSARRRLR